MKYYRFKNGLGIKENNNGRFEVIHFSDCGCGICLERANCEQDPICEDSELCHLKIGEYGTLQGALLKYASTSIECMLTAEGVTYLFTETWVNLSDFLSKITDEVLIAEKALKKGEWES